MEQTEKLVKPKLVDGFTPSRTVLSFDPRTFGRRGALSIALGSRRHRPHGFSNTPLDSDSPTSCKLYSDIMAVGKLPHERGLLKVIPQESGWSNCCSQRCHQTWPHRGSPPLPCNTNATRGSSQPVQAASRRGNETRALLRKHLRRWILKHQTLSSVTF